MLKPYYGGEGVRLCPSTILDTNKWFQDREAAPADTPHRYVRRDGTTVLGWFLTSYAINGRFTPTYTKHQPHLFFRTEGDVQKPSLSPVFADANYHTAQPEESAEPARDLYFPFNNIGINQMHWFTLARHGRRGPTRSSLPVAPGQPLGPWVNHLACFDGHVERAKLDNLWNYYWHKEWTPPPVRPP